MTVPTAALGMTSPKFRSTFLTMVIGAMIRALALAEVVAVFCAALTVDAMVRAATVVRAKRVMVFMIFSFSLSALRRLLSFVIWARLIEAHRTQRSSTKKDTRVNLRSIGSPRRPNRHQSVIRT